jgi:hypothetical protein
MLRPMRESLETVRYWLGDYGRALLLVLGLAAFFVAVGIYATGFYAQAATEEVGDVVGFGAYATETGARPAVRVRLESGRVVQLQTDEARTRACRAGSRIRLVRRGNLLTVHPRGCMAPPP